MMSLVDEGHSCYLTNGRKVKEIPNTKDTTNITKLITTKSFFPFSAPTTNKKRDRAAGISNTQTDIKIALYPPNNRASIPCRYNIVSDSFAQNTGK